MAMAIDFETYDDDNIFAKILRGELPNTTVFEDDHVLAFYDIAPAAPVHVLVIPKGRYIAHDDFHREASDEEIVAFWRAVSRICDDLGVTKDGHRLIANQGSGEITQHAIGSNDGWLGRRRSQQQSCQRQRHWQRHSKMTNFAK